MIQQKHTVRNVLTIWALELIGLWIIVLYYGLTLPTIIAGIFIYVACISALIYLDRKGA